MFRVLLSFSFLPILVTGCGETRHPVRQETVALPAPESEDSGAAALPPGHPPMSAMQSTMPAMPPSGGDLQITAPEGWIAVQPTGMMRPDAEFALPKVEGDEDHGRLTVMRAGGSIEANLERWRGQFEELQDKPAEETDVSGTKVTLVDFSGTFNEQRGMTGTTVKRPGYRMLAAIVELPDGLLFVKAYGPANTMAKHADEFRDFVESLATPDQ
jgi:hypothetical protein